MRKSIYLGCICLATVLLFSTCDKLNKVNFEHKVTVYFDINQVNPGEYTYAEVIVTNDIEEALNNYGGSLDKLRSLKVIGFEMELQFPTGATFDPFDNLDAYIMAGNLGEGLIASVDPVPDDGQTLIQFRAEDLELVDYFREPEFTLLVKGSNSQATNGTTSFRLTMKVDVETEVL